MKKQSKVSDKKKAVIKKRPSTRVRAREVEAAPKRATTYNKNMAFEILDVMEEKQMSLRQALQQKPEYPTRRTFYRWRNAQPKLEEEYQLVCEVRDDNDFDEIEEIAAGTTDENYNTTRMQIDARKWTLARRQPSRYGTKKLDLKAAHSGEIIMEVVNYADDADDGTE